MAVPQITIRLEANLKNEFERYASKLGLRSSELAKLLIVREREQRRLLKVKSSADRQRRISAPGNRLPTVTAHLSSLEEVERFDAYAQSCGLNRNGAGARLLETELRERWLEAAIKTPVS